MTLIYLSLSWIAGIITGLNFDIPTIWILTGILPFPLLLLKKYTKQLLLFGFCILSFFGGSFCAQSCLPQDNSAYLNYFNDTGIVTLTGMVSEAPDVRDNSTQLCIEVTQIKTGGEDYNVEGKALVFVSRYPTYNYGDVIRIIGELKTPPQFEDFDYAEYLSCENIYSTILYPQIELLKTGQGSAPLGWIYSLRNELSLSLARVLPEPSASLAQGMILGIRSNIPDDLKEDFSVTGTAHLLAISGLHMGIVAGIALSIGLWLFGRRHYFYIWLALAVIWAYAILTGMNAPVVRSAVMASVFLTAELLGRQRSTITALTFAAAIMVGFDPQIIFTASFQMSFMAMAGLIFILPTLQNTGRKLTLRTIGGLPSIVPAVGLLADSFSVTIAALIGVFPLVAYYFGIVSLVSAPATLLALPALAGIIMLGIITAGLGLFLLPAAQVIGWLLWLMLSYVILVVNRFAALPLSYFDVGSFNAVYLWIYYIALGFILWAGQKYRLSKTAEDEDIENEQLAAFKPAKSEKKSFFFRRPVKWIVFSIVITAILCIVTINNTPDENLHVTFLDVGQGDAILLQKGHTQVLIDGGSSPRAIGLALSGEMPFYDRTIELVVLTHPHDDHLTGLVDVLNEYKVEQVLTTNTFSELPLYAEWLRLISENNIECTPALARQQVIIDDVIIDVLNPQVTYFSGTGSDSDNNSIVLNVSFGDISFLLTGDLRWEGEFELITERLVSGVTILKAGHHGSNTSTSDEFLNVVRPQIAVISVGLNNSYGHPNEEVIERLSKMIGVENIYRTDINGSIEFITDGKGLWVMTTK